MDLKCIGGGFILRFVDTARKSVTPLPKNEKEKDKNFIYKNIREHILLYNIVITIIIVLIILVIY